MAALAPALLGRVRGRCWGAARALLGAAAAAASRWLPRHAGQRPRRLASSARSMAARVRFSPAGRSLFDEPLAIWVEALRPRQEVTLRARLKDEGGEVFESRAFYRADGDGRLDPSRSPALEGRGGTFAGLDPMGLLWSLEPHKPFRRLVKRDVQRPFVLEVDVLEGHGEPGSAAVVAQGAHERSFLRDGVHRIPVREGNVRGTLFLPPGNGPFPGVIDIYGTGGGLPEYRASLLAGHGFAVLALAYYKFEDLPKEMKEFHLEYFEEALNYMLKHPKVKSPGIGLLGHSKGVDLCVAMASFLKGIAATVSINGAMANVGAVLRYKDITFPPLGFDLKRVKIDKSGVLDIIDVLDNPYDNPDHPSLIPLEKADGRFLFIVAKDDHNWKSEFLATEASKRLQAHGREKPEIICYPGAGHYIEPPYMPMCPVSMHLMLGKQVMWGGEPKAHAAAQVDAWQQIQGFFHKHLSGKQGERQNKL